MDTIILKINKNKPEIEKLQKAADVLKNGGIIAFPTDTVYGLAGGAFNTQARKKIYKLKGRSFRKPLIVMPPNIESLNCMVEMSEQAGKLIKKFWPGPLTLIFSTTSIGKMIMDGRADMGARIPDNKIVLKLLKLYGSPIVTTSANISSKPSAKNGKEAAAYFKDKIDLILDAGQCNIGMESTVVDARHFHCTIVRQGCLQSKELLKYII